MKRSDEGSVFHRGGKWYARLRYTDADGSDREKKRTVPTRAAGWAMVSKLRDEIADDIRDRKTYRDLDTFYRTRYVHEAVYRDGKKISGFRQPLATVRLYLDAALAHFGDRPLDAITYRDLDNYKLKIVDLPVIRSEIVDGKRREKKCPRSTADVNAHLKRLRRVLRVAVMNGWLDQHPFEKGDPLVIESHAVERTRVLDHDEETRLLAACVGKRKHLRPLVVFAIETAMRRGEIQRLKWSDIDMTGRVITVQSMNTKTMKARTVPIFERCRDILLELRGNRLFAATPVFGRHDCKNAWGTACRDAGLADVTFHDLRHTGTTRMIEERNLPIGVVMKITGHTQERTFMRYLNQSGASMYEIATRFDRGRKTG